MVSRRWQRAAIASVQATFPVVKTALADTGPLTFAALRFSLAGAVVLVYLLRRRVDLPRTAWPYWCGVSLLAGYVLQTWGLVTTTPARSAFISTRAHCR